MSDIFSLDKILLFVAVFVPGFISSTVYGFFVPVAPADFGKDLPRILGYSFLHYALTLWIVVLAPEGLPRIVAIYAVVFVLPALWPPLILMLRRPDRWVQPFQSGKFVGAMLDPHQVPWDYLFDSIQQSGGCWVRIKLKAGGYVGGKYGEGSSSSSYPDDGQIYLSQEFSFDMNGLPEQQPEDRSLGIWVPTSEIEYISFFF
jgi:Family of unknown function (DUF6338)